jgi:thiol-disulfide isomerase/thioredoxin
MRRTLGTALAAGVLVFAGCTAEPERAPIVPPPGGVPESSVQVDTPELRDLKQRAGIEDCEPGPGAGDDGGDLPALTLACLGGGQAVDLASLRGPMVINLWQTACEACEVEMPILQAFHTAYGERVAVLGIDSTDVFPGSALEVLGERGVTYPQLADPGGDLQDTDAFAKVRGYPWLFFVDEGGRIVYQHAGAVRSDEDLTDLVTEHLGVSL